ncbi:hypothetical protein KUTeg_006631 [Tegillarca granosa]|uniref:Uncharacterized protein n=1 Tax=Tegillarca granosa TaxID=220873 RepID=A0ABQ9FAY1_TEGGR|nr:hypothetical protein KUTeg_006631 [Tegillarca granosa]
MRGIFILRPSLPRYNVTWNVNSDLNYLDTINCSSAINLKSLTLKVVVLLCLLSGQRFYLD